MESHLDDPKIIKPEDIDPHHEWSRALRSPGTMNVDFEERVNFQRLHRYRLGRTRMALRNSDLGSLLTFDYNNIRYHHQHCDWRVGTRQDVPLCAVAGRRGSTPVGFRFRGSASPDLCTLAQAFLLSCRHGGATRYSVARIRPDATRGRRNQGRIGAKRRGRPTCWC